MILFTSDLDRTLLYSERMVARYPCEQEVISVETKNGQAVGFMTKQATQRLLEFHKTHWFVPVTTRSVEQYERIHFLIREIGPKFAVAANGGVLLINGKRDEAWSMVLTKRLEDTSISPGVVLQLFSKIRHEEWVEREFFVEDLFYMFHVDRDAMPMEEVSDLQNELHTVGWRLVLQGSKLYLMPRSLSKEEAVTYVKTQITFDWHVAAGDSELDGPMLQEADVAFCPKHGVLFDAYCSESHARRLPEEGIAFGEALIDAIMEEDARRMTSINQRN